MDEINAWQLAFDGDFIDKNENDYDYLTVIDVIYHVIYLLSMISPFFWVTLSPFDECSTLVKVTQVDDPKLQLKLISQS